MESVRSAVAEVDIEGLDAPVAAQIVEECAEAERLLAALRVLATATLTDKAVWRREGFRSAAHWMASKTGTAVGLARKTMEMAGLLDGLPILAAAFREGLLSEAQAREIAAVVADVPEAEGHLVEAARKLTLHELREECKRVEAAAVVDEDDRHRRIHRKRHVRVWTDRYGEGHLSATGPPDALARLMGVVDRSTGEIIEGAIRGGWFESFEAHRFDALIELALPGTTGQGGADNMVHVMVDYEALMRGHTVTGEECEIPGIGPVPVSVARRMSEDCILKILLTKGVDVVAVAHAGRTIPKHLASALEARDRTCIVPGCNIDRNLEKDHRDSWARTQITKLEELAHLCRWHHYQKTFLGYTYRGGPGTWEWIPPENRDEDLSELSRIITSARRC